MMKRFTAVLAALAMLLTLTMTVSAQEQEAVTVTVGSIKGEVGDIVQVPVSVSDGHYLVNGRIFLTYDPTVLELQEVCDDEDNPYFEAINEDIIDSSFMWAFAVPAAGRANFVFATSSDSGNATGGAIYTLTFKLLQVTDAASIVVTIPEMRSNNGGEDYDAAPTVENGKVVVKPYDATPDLKGDVNGDGVVTFHDAVRLFYFVNGSLELTDKQFKNADVNENGVVNLLDTTRLFNHVSGGGVEL